VRLLKSRRHPDTSAETSSATVEPCHHGGRGRGRSLSRVRGAQSVTSASGSDTIQSYTAPSEVRLFIFISCLFPCVFVSISDVIVKCFKFCVVIELLFRCLFRVRRVTVTTY